MDCPSDTSWYWLALICLSLLCVWLYGSLKEAQNFIDGNKGVPDFFNENEMSRHRKRQKRKEKLDKARVEREKNIRVQGREIPIQEVETEVSLEQVDDASGLVPVDEGDDDDESPFKE